MKAGGGGKALAELNKVRNMLTEHLDQWIHREAITQPLPSEWKHVKLGAQHLSVLRSSGEQSPRHVKAQALSTSGPLISSSWPGGKVTVRTVT